VKRILIMLIAGTTSLLAPIQAGLRLR